MAHEVVDEPPPLHMGLPVSNGKLAMWLFLVTEIMFFTGLIGTYIVLRNGSRNWPTPAQVHLVEWIGALNTFVLIFSSFTVVLALAALHKGETGKSIQYITVTLALGGVFLVIKGFEYHAKIAHQILPGLVPYDRFQGSAGTNYRKYLHEQLEEMVKDPKQHGLSPGAVDDCKFLQGVLDSFRSGSTLTTDQGKTLLSLVEDPMAKIGFSLSHLRQQLNENSASEETQTKVVSAAVEGLVHKYPEMHVHYVIPYGNIWASVYFALTGFHALHVLGGLVVFVIMIGMFAVGSFGPQHTYFVELTGLYWHFVDIVWIFLFPLLYLV
jgi:cytochrome c oxidase subunit 3